MRKMNHRLLMWGSVLTVFLTGSVFAAYPTEVQNVQGTTNGTQVNLTWDAATAPDDVITSYRVYWGTTSVQTENDFYTKESLVSPVATTFTVDTLIPGTTYYFAVTAINSLDEESETYSKEISVRIPATAGENLKIISAQQNAESGVKVTMSASVSISPIRDGFIVTELNTGKNIPVIGGVIQNEQVLLSLSELLTPGFSYKIMATSLVKDEFGTPIKSGITDSITFSADWTTDAGPVTTLPRTETDPPLDTPDETNNPVDVPTDDPILEFPELTPPATEPTTPITIDTPDLFPSFEPGTDKPSAPATPDVVAPLDVTNFQVDTSGIATDHSVLFTWNKSLDLEKDAVDQILYVREDLNDWDDGYSIGTNLEKITLDIDPGHNYQVKIVTVDHNNNHSAGATVSFSTQLPKSGPAGMFGAAVALIVLAVLGLSVARRRTT